MKLFWWGNLGTQLWEIGAVRLGRKTKIEQRWAGSVLLYCSVCRATWRPTSTRRRSTWTRRWLLPSRPATPADCRSSPADRTLYPRRRGRGAPARSRTCPVNGLPTRPDWSLSRRKAMLNAEATEADASHALHGILLAVEMAFAHLLNLVYPDLKVTWKNISNFTINLQQNRFSKIH